MDRLKCGDWAMEYGCIQGGLVLRDITHALFHLARDIRVVRVWVDTEYPDSSAHSGHGQRQDYVLNSPELPLVAGPMLEETGILTKNPSQFFNSYHNMFALLAHYRSTVPYLAGTANAAPLDIMQQYLFGNYGKNPPHEASGLLDAARIFPLTYFSFPKVVKPHLPYPKYCRIDYRLDVNLDNITSEDTAAQRIPDIVDPANKAGIFRDREAAPDFGEVLDDGVYALFDGFEKPVPYELASYGLVAGMPVDGVERRSTWDNIHIWPARQRIATPGGFHAFHCHWRWGAVSGAPRAGGTLFPYTGETQFKGLGWTESSAGPLISAQLPRQNLQLAITNNSPVWKESLNPSDVPFRNLFERQPGHPLAIGDGADLVLWLSFEVFRDEGRLNEAWGGPVFVNGCYFAHNADMTPLRLALAGVLDKGLNSTNPEQWFRLAPGYKRHQSLGF
jgi:hypothetical protein